MNDRMTASANTVWTLTPPAHKNTVEIYHNWTICDAYFDGAAWRNPKTEEVITTHAYWRDKR